MTGLYLVNKPTNPASQAASEAILPVQPPRDPKGNILPLLTPPDSDGSELPVAPSNTPVPTKGVDTKVTLEECQKLFSLRDTDTDAGYKAGCDKNGDKKIDAADYELMARPATN